MQLNVCKSAEPCPFGGPCHGCNPDTGEVCKNVWSVGSFKTRFQLTKKGKFYANCDYRGTDIETILSFFKGTYEIDSNDHRWEPKYTPGQYTENQLPDGIKIQILIEDGFVEEIEVK